MKPNQPKARARTFKTRRFQAIGRLISERDEDAIFAVERELNSILSPEQRAAEKRRGGLVANIDYLNRTYGHSPHPHLRLGYWTRKEMWNRLRWLRGEITRLMLKQPSRWSTWKTNDERIAELAKRKAQEQKYMRALEQYAPLHKAIRDLKRNRAKQQKRAKAKQEARQALRQAIRQQRADLTGRPVKPVPVRKKLRGLATIEDELLR